jgi:hypothetical protein
VRGVKTFVWVLALKQLKHLSRPYSRSLGVHGRVTNDYGGARAGGPSKSRPTFAVLRPETFETEFLGAVDFADIGGRCGSHGFQSFHGSRSKHDHLQGI